MRLHHALGEQEGTIRGPRVDRMSALVAVVGSLNADLTLPVPHLPRPGETVLAAGPAHLAFGGKGANQAAAAAAFGGQVAMIGRVGADEAGRAILADLHRLGIDARGILLTEGERAGTATIAVDEAGDGTPGLEVSRCNETVGSRYMNNGEITFADCRIPEHHLLAHGNALGRAGVYFRPGKIIVAAKNLGTGIAAYDDTAAWVQQRARRRSWRSASTPSNCTAAMGPCSKQE